MKIYLCDWCKASSQNYEMIIYKYFRPKSILFAERHFCSIEHLLKSLDLDGYLINKHLRFNLIADEWENIK